MGRGRGLPQLPRMSSSDASDPVDPQMPPTASASSEVDRPMGQAIGRGLRRLCPACGDASAFDGFLSIRAACPACDEELHHHRADDGPAYLTILIVGHLMAPLILVVFTAWRPEPLTLAAVFSVGCVGLSLFLLPRLKGLVLAIQWSRRMHGFGRADAA